MGKYEIMFGKDSATNAFNDIYDTKTYSYTYIVWVSALEYNNKLLRKY